MTKLTAHHTYDDEDPSRIIASIHPASAASIALVAKASESSLDGRSQFMWVRLPNGDLILGVFPQGETYCACEHDAQYKETR
jgi:hypothetical protein